MPLSVHYRWWTLSRQKQHALDRLQWTLTRKTLPGDLDRPVCQSRSPKTKEIGEPAAARGGLSDAAISLFYNAQSWATLSDLGHDGNLDRVGALHRGGTKNRAQIEIL